jgi:GT2 family glycosyltransferase
MLAAQLPLVSVITVNFNGARYLADLLNSLESQSYPRFEVLVVDNGSTDGSIPLVRDSFPQVRVVEARQNLGFAEGNNFGIREARGAYVALINNDTVVEPDWLANLVEDACASPTIGAVGSKILFARPFVPVTVVTATFSPARTGDSADGRELGVIVGEDSRFLSCSYRKAIFQSGFYGSEDIQGEQARWTQGRATILLPVETLNQPGDLCLRLNRGQSPAPGAVTVKIGNTTVANLEVGSGWQQHVLPAPPEITRQEGFDVINNAASFLKADGIAGDRGIYEPDRGQYDAAEDVTALCGCSMLVSRAALDRAGLFDRDFFMYFEDTELCWRLRKSGYRLRYQPASIVRHIHAATSVEWSQTFNYLVGRNRVLMLLKHARPGQASRAYLEELYRLLTVLKARRSLRDDDVRTRLRIQRSLLLGAPRAVLKRLGLLPH